MLFPNKATYSVFQFASNMFMRTDWRDTIYKRILQSPLGKANRYVYKGQ